MPIKGFRDIRTHGSLAREGKLFSVAKNLHGHGRFREMRSQAESGDEWNVHVFRRDKKPAVRFSHFSSFPFSFEELKKIRMHQVEVASDLLRELHQALAEGLPVVASELERVKRLAETKM